MKPEAQLWSWLKTGLKPFGSKADAHRIETTTECGYPDVEAVIQGVQFTCELKVAHYIRKNGTFALDHYTQDQAYFAHKRILAGGRAWMLIRIPESPTVNKHLLIHGKHMVEVFENRAQLSYLYLSNLSFQVKDEKSQSFWQAMISPPF